MGQTSIYKYQMGEKIEAGATTFKVIGYEVVLGRGIRYIVAFWDDEKNECTWQYLYDFEIEMITL